MIKKIDVSFVPRCLIKNITEEDMLAVASKNKIDLDVAKSIIEKCKKVIAKNDFKFK